ncbi:hypothetical protein LCI18_013877 [Fusarium solani-melongenae]|uniref:Uncharacterized protein n=1 Tax=Fusarium solani subsp. cucurbitae TaxID=2747967 RepID=A0ACD3ZPR2_FUSSC|nr:hypothetical protein LCI18_013877 [Fusarium solani-melongenae]
MRLLIRQDDEQVCWAASEYIAHRIRQFNPTSSKPFVLGLPTGSTPLLVYRNLVHMHKRGELSFQNVVTFNMDEYVGLPPDHEQSYHRFMYDNFFNHIDIRPENIHIPDGNAPDLEAACAAYEEAIIRAGGIELFMGGMGSDGHMAFNEPGSSLQSRTRLKALTTETIKANARFFDGDESKVPRSAVTVGVQTVMDAREVLILVTGAHKSLALMKCVEEGVNHMWTLSCLQLHQHATLVVDEEATLDLKIKTVKYFRSIDSDLVPSPSHQLKSFRDDEKQTDHGILAPGPGVNIISVVASTKEASVPSTTETFMGALKSGFTSAGAQQRSRTPDPILDSMGSRIVK